MSAASLDLSLLATGGRGDFDEDLIVRSTGNLDRSDLADELLAPADARAEPVRALLSLWTGAKTILKASSVEVSSSPEGLEFGGVPMWDVSGLQCCGGPDAGT